MFRSGVSLVLVSLGIAILCVDVLFGSLRSEVISFNRKVQARFEATAIDVEAFRRANDRLPERDEFNRFADRTPIPGISSGFHGPSSGPYLVSGRDIRNCSGSDEELAALEKATFVLAMHNGDWADCFSSSPKVSTLALSSEDFPNDNSDWAWRLFALSLLAGAALLMMPRWLKRKTG